MMTALVLRFPLSKLMAATRARLSGPGGYYNIGNGLGLVMGVVIQIATMPQGAEPPADHAVLAAADYFAGSDAALALTLATLIFCWSGEAYHRAWATADAPDPALNRLGDHLSGIGALALGVALFLTGEPVLAATSGLLHAAGKFGSALHLTGLASLFRWPAAWPDPFRSAVLVSRLPALLAAALATAAALPEALAGGHLAAVAAPATLLICYLLWAKADLLLFRSA